MSTVLLQEMLEAAANKGTEIVIAVSVESSDQSATRTSTLNIEHPTLRQNKSRLVRESLNKLVDDVCRSMGVE